MKKTITVEASQAKAFKVFTANFDNWWPRENKIGRTALKQAVLEPRNGGRWYEVGEDGSECDWGTVLAFEPTARLLLAWQISATWQYDPTFVTEVEVRFIEEGPKRTRVELEHRNLDRYGETAGTMRDVFASPNGWGGILARFGKLAAENS
jgi:hypothetical protein